MPLLIFALAFFFPLPLPAEDGFISRRDGFMLIWEGIRRTAYEPGQIFNDVKEGDYGYEEITYAADRNILDDADRFDSDTPLNMEDALLWLFRTRNVRDIFYMQRENIPGMLDEYPIAGFSGDLSERHLTDAGLTELARKLDSMLMEEVHLVSYYAEDFHGNGTAFGETFDMNGMTAAHRTFPHNTLVKVTNIDNRKSVIVRINDRGPYVDGRDMDLSLAAFNKIAPLGQGVVRAVFQRLGDETFVDECSQESMRFQKRITKNVRFHRGVPHAWSVGHNLSLGANRYFVVRGIRYPDGYDARTQDFVAPEERFNFTPSVAGEYVFTVGTVEGNVREMRMMVKSCEG